MTPDTVTQIAVAAIAYRNADALVHQHMRDAFTAAGHSIRLATADNAVRARELARRALIEAVDRHLEEAPA